MKISIVLACLYFSAFAKAQVGINTNSPSSASVLHVASSQNGSDFGGFMPPKVTVVQRDAIPVTASDDGMMVYISDGTTREVQFWNGVDLTWETVYSMPSNSLGGVFISELADPNNNSNARFVELFNGSTSDIDISDWEFQKYVNAGATVQSFVIPSGTTIAAGTALVFSNNSSNFNSTYGFVPDFSDTIIDGVFGSNGDDTIALLDDTGTVVDIFGIIGVDGSGTCHEFEDGRALRDSTVTVGNPIWNEANWLVNADSAIMGCTSHTNVTVNAPGGFSPGTHPN